MASLQFYRRTIVQAPSWDKEIGRILGPYFQGFTDYLISIHPLAVSTMHLLRGLPLGITGKRTEKSTTKSPMPQPMSPISATSQTSRNSTLVDSILETTRDVTTVLGQSIPLPFVQGVCGSVVVLLDQISLMRSNEQALMEVVEEASAIIAIIYNEIQVDGVSAKKPSPLMLNDAFKQTCLDLTQSLDAITQRLKKHQNAPKGLKHVTGRFFKASQLSREIADHRAKIESLKSGYTLAMVAGTRVKVSSVKRGVDHLRSDLEQTKGAVDNLHQSLNKNLEENRAQLREIQKSVKQRDAGAPMWNLETTNYSQNHLIRNTENGSFSSTHGAIIRTNRSKPSSRLKAAVKDHSQGHDISNQGRKMKIHHGPIYEMP